MDAAEEKLSTRIVEIIDTYSIAIDKIARNTDYTDDNIRSIIRMISGDFDTAVLNTINSYCEIIVENRKP